MTEYYLVDVKSITSKVSRSEFRVDELEQFAQSILESGGLLTPLLLKQMDAERYEVLAGDYQYYASVRAKEINPRVGEMVNAFVIPPKFQEAALKQMSLLGKTQEHKTEPSQPQVNNSSASDLRLTNLESRLDEVIRDIKQTHAQDIKRLEQEVLQIRKQLPQPIEPLEAFNNLSILELVQKLATANIRGKTAKNLVGAIEQERKKSQFTSLSDVVRRIKGLGEKRMLSIIDAWSGTY